MPNERLGRIRMPDYRDHAFRMQIAPVPIQAYKQWNEPPVLDQGSTSQCVVYSGFGYLQAGPVTNPISKLPWSFEQAYKICQQNDEWPGEAYDGTSVRAIFKLFQKEGYVANYVWAPNAVAIQNWLAIKGPVVVGTDWTESMFETETFDAPGPQGKAEWCRLFPERSPRENPVVGGHAYLLIGVDTRRICPDGSIGAARMQNSWGKGWGTGGRAYISLRDLDILIRNGGEACTAIEQRPTRTQAA